MQYWDEDKKQFVYVSKNNPLPVEYVEPAEEAQAEGGEGE